MQYKQVLWPKSANVGLPEATYYDCTPLPDLDRTDLPVQRSDGATICCKRDASLVSIRIPPPKAVGYPSSDPTS